VASLFQTDTENVGLPISIEYSKYVQPVTALHSPLIRPFQARFCFLRDAI